MSGGQNRWTRVLWLAFAAFVVLGLVGIWTSARQAGFRAEWVALAVGIFGAGMALVLVGRDRTGDGIGTMFEAVGISLAAGAVVSFAVFVATSSLEQTLSQQEERNDNARLVREVATDPGVRTRHFAEMDLRGAQLAGFDLTGAVFSGADLRDANLREAILSRSDLRGVNLSDAELTDADLSGAVRLSDADLSDADLSRADLRGAGLSNADLSHARLSEVDLTNATLDRANVADADLRGADLSGADLSDVEHLDDAQFRGVRCDADTQWPDSAQHPPCAEPN